MKAKDFPDVPPFDPVPTARAKTNIYDADRALACWIGWACKDVDIHPDGGHQVTLVRNGVEVVIHMDHGKEVSRSDRA